MSDVVSVIDAVGRIGLVAAAASIATLIVTKVFDERSQGRQQTWLLKQEERASLARYRDYQRETIVELQDILWPLYSCCLTLFKSDTEILAGGSPVVLNRQIQTVEDDFVRLSERCELLAHRLEHDELRHLGVTLWLQAIYMQDRTRDENEFGASRVKYERAHSEFKRLSREQIKELMAPSA